MKKLVALLLTFLLVLTGCNGIEVTKVEDDIQTDAIRFSKEYNLEDNNNVYKYATYDSVIDIVKHGTGIIYLGFPNCDLCKEVIPVLNEVVKEKDIDEVLYYNFKDIRENNTNEYIELVDLIAEYIKTDDEGNKMLQAPTIIFVNKGTIVGVYIGMINSSSEELMSDDEKNNLKQNFSSLIDKMRIVDITTEM